MTLKIIFTALLTHDIAASYRPTFFLAIQERCMQALAKPKPLAFQTNSNIKWQKVKYNKFWRQLKSGSCHYKGHLPLLELGHPCLVSVCAALQEQHKLPISVTNH